MFLLPQIKEPLSLAVCSSYGEEVPVAATLAASLADVDQQFVHLKKVVEQKGEREGCFFHSESL